MHAYIRTIHIYMYMYACTYLYVSMHVCRYTQAQTHTDTHTDTRTQNTNTHKHTHTHTHTHTQANTHILTHTLTHTHKHMYIQTTILIRWQQLEGSQKVRVDLQKNPIQRGSVHQRDLTLFRVILETSRSASLGCLFLRLLGLQQAAAGCSRLQQAATGY